MKLNDHQRRLWQGMIDLIESYLNSETQEFNTIVGKLEGALDASEIKDINLINQWYDFWMPLEIYRATDGNKINREKIIQDLQKMKKFLIKNL